jgi:methionine-rich copper-binding protein CopC
MLRRPLSIAAAFGAVAALLATQAAAHARLVTSSPAANAVVAAAPGAISLTFNEKLVPAFSGFELTMVEHKMKVAVKAEVSSDGLTLRGVPQGKLMPGTYKVSWHAASADGHRMSGDITFKIG